MTKQHLINKIEDPNVGDNAKHRYAEKLISEFNGVDTQSFLLKKFIDTNDDFYISLIKKYGRMWVV